ncbi:MAG: PLP-dependent aminotransferase family protein [Chloroflexota bacterium]
MIRPAPDQTQMIDLTIDYKSNIPLNRQIYLQIRDQILDGTLPCESRIPATREIARKYEMARMTVNVAYEQLELEGYVISRPGSGTYVSHQLDLLDQEKRSVDLELSSWAQRMLKSNAIPGTEISRQSSESGHPNVEIDFGFGRSFASIFPYDVWRKLLARYLSTDDAILDRYGSVAGFGPLREAIAGYVGRQRGVKCRPEQVFIVSGIQQALDILGRLLINPNDEVLVETPGYVNACRIFRSHGAQLRPIQVDENGFKPERIPEDSKAKLIFVTPSNQFPHGGAMPIQRRLELIQWARTHNSLIIEDDYDGELRYVGSPISALQGLDDSDRVIYLGTFSKVLLPALRLGYVILPQQLCEPFLQAKMLMDRGAPTLTQAAIADFITEGHFERHLRNLRKLYAERRGVLVRAIHAHLDGLATYSDHPAGFHVMLYLKEGVNEQHVIAEMRKRGVAIYAGRPYHLGEWTPPSLILGFSGLESHQIDEGIKRLGEVLKQPPVSLN